MPRRYAKKKRAYKKKRTYRKRRANPRKPLSGFPSKKLVKLRYTDQTITVDAPIGGHGSHVFRANSVFDPDYTSLGHQPMGFDQWANIYTRYTVVGAKMTVRYTPIAASNNVPGYMGTTLGTTADPLAGFSSINNILESKLTGKYMVVGSIYSPAISSRGDGYPAVSRYFSAKKFFGKVNVQDGNSTSALVTTNPSDTAYFSVWVASIDANNPASVSMTVSIDYIVLFHEPKTLDGS